MMVGGGRRDRRRAVWAAALCGAQPGARQDIWCLRSAPTGSLPRNVAEFESDAQRITRFNSPTRWAGMHGFTSTARIPQAFALILTSTSH